MVSAWLNYNSETSIKLYPLHYLSDNKVFYSNLRYTHQVTGGFYSNLRYTHQVTGGFYSNLRYTHQVTGGFYSNLRYTHDHQVTGGFCGVLKFKAWKQILKHFYNATWQIFFSSGYISL